MQPLVLKDLGWPETGTVVDVVVVVVVVVVDVVVDSKNIIVINLSFEDKDI